jgi:hypothetical protein
MIEAGGVIVEREQRIASASKTSGIRKFSNQNGTNGIGVADHILHNGTASVTSKLLSGSEYTLSASLTAGNGEPEVRKSHDQKTISAENAVYLNGKFHH